MFTNASTPSKHNSWRIERQEKQCPVKKQHRKHEQSRKTNIIIQITLPEFLA
ncbi:MAG: hypothetical protein QXY87_09570 [Saccharolobus sp.]|uniref:hypothetical protein n=1 Tax=Saccharolobus TaxID=2100760 RepID=UPI001C4524D8|nr:hypothetical protein [Saccharolobus shibatae]MCH4815795.1 hypothetical protein [Saccharolobus shibatae]